MHSANRVLVMHTGNLPRPDDLTRMMFAKEEGSADRIRNVEKAMNWCTHASGPRKTEVC